MNSGHLFRSGRLFGTIEKWLKLKHFSHAQRWPEDALRKSAEIIFEEINADRNAKKTVIQIGINIYEKAM